MGKSHSVHNCVSSNSSTNKANRVIGVKNNTVFYVPMVYMLIKIIIHII